MHRSCARCSRAPQPLQAFRSIEPPFSTGFGTKIGAADIAFAVRVVVGKRCPDTAAPVASASCAMVQQPL